MFDINDTNIVLVPKRRDPCNMIHFRPISLCNVLLKIISKVLVNKLQRVMSHYIDEGQNTFVLGRLITDNVIVTLEMLYSFQKKRYGLRGTFSLKLDMSKAYNRVECNLVQAIIFHMSFCEKWVALIMHCIRTVCYSIIVNGTPKGYITPTRGLPQGDPLSPLLFLFYNDELSTLHRLVTIDGRLLGVRAS